MATEFQQQVWGALEKIPKGRVTTYGDIACYIKKPKAARAVGSACGANPQLVAVPCHRVVTGTGRVGNYAGGVQKKKELLAQEGVRIENDKVVDFTSKRYTF